MKTRRPTKVYLFAVLGVVTFSVFTTSNAQQHDRQLERQPTVSNVQSGRRTALVIGNGTYTSVPALKNPPNDAALVAATLQDLGFEVSVGTNKSQKEMKQLIRDFGQRLRASGGVGLFYFAGHGVQSNGHNYLIPVDADIQNEADLEDVGVDVNYVLNMMAVAQSSLNILILDACRNNPFTRSFRSAQGGLAHVDAPSGTLIAYATAPNSTAADGDSTNSPYTEELTKQMQIPGVVLETAFRRVTERVSTRTAGRQEPWTSDNHKGEFYFKSSANSSTANADSAKIDPVTVEREYWETIRNSKDAQDFESYLQTYPNGAYATIARAKINQIKASSTARDPKTESGNDTASDKNFPRIRDDRSVNVRSASISQFTEDYPILLQVSGQGWDGGSEVKVFLNGEEISIPVDSQGVGHIAFKGSVQQLHAHDGRNEVFIEVNGVRSNSYVFRQAVTIGPVANQKNGSGIEDIAGTNADWQLVRGDGFSILMPKGSMSEARQGLYNGGRVSRTVQRTPIGQRPFFGVISASGINARASRPTDAEKLNSYVDAFKYWLPEAVFGKGQAASLSLTGENASGGNPGREYQVTVGDLSGTARAYFRGGRFVVAVALDASADQASQFFNS
ncbi:MAG TPA: caspase family protein, partial [Pyrinomonadaceae bacterium]|nr:caspase family protein [Pyrinomonadaceae bacterium]